MQYIRDLYGVAARRGGRVWFDSGLGLREARILSARGGYLYLRFLGESRRRGPFHPTWKIEYDLQGVTESAP